MRQFILLFFILSLCYVLGLFVPLMNGDAAHHANIALHMYLTHDYVNLIDKGTDYLDKPHLLFWLSAASYHIFGVNAFAYKLPSLLFSIAGIWATYKVGRRLYNIKTGLVAALILASAQAFILASMDVRMDAILTACIILASWQLLEATIAQKWHNLLGAALFMGLGFSTKGLVGIIIPCATLFFYLLYKRDFEQMLHPKWLLTAALTAVFMLPVIFCFYLQYDLHPEKQIRGMTHISGVKFILWGQNIERLDGEAWGGGRRDYFYFFHTLLWAFLPWSLIAYYAMGSRLKNLWRSRMAYVKNFETFTIGAILFVFIIISTSRFQLPHYLNILFPFLSILTAAKLVELDKKRRLPALKSLFILQACIAFCIVVLIAVLYFWSFRQHIVIFGIVTFAGLFIMAWNSFEQDSSFSKIITISITGIAFVNIILNGFFYPQLLKYQGGSNLAAGVKQKQIETENIYSYNTNNFTFDFDTKHLTPKLTLEQVKNKPAMSYWLYTDAIGLDSLRQINIPVAESIQSIDYHVTRLKPAFLNPVTRSQTLDTVYLLRIAP
ncbi:MAG TPA: glycosyltransferase family 39 protein [Agriterribacter sp.]|nr:glycosyltransferase family 39 protein [Agriterribacter sp.]